MKKKLVLMLAIISVLCCLLALGINAAEPDTSKETVTLDDGTVCALWDTEGNPLIWYVTSNNGGVKTYAYVDATSSAVDYYNSWSGGNQLNKITITVEGVEYAVSTIAVANIRQAKITSGNRIGNTVDYFSKTFNGCTNLEYVYVPEVTIGFSTEDFKSCSNLKYINIVELTELATIGSQTFNGCSKLFANMSLDLSGTKINSIGAGGLSSVAATSITLPSTLKNVQNYAFRSCSNMTKITFNSTLTTINTAELFRYCSKLEEIAGFRPTIESGIIKSIGNYMFEGCKLLRNIDGLMTEGILIIPEGVTSINSPCAFSECDQITYVEFPSTINFVGQAAFSFCDNIKLVSFDKVDAKIKEAIANGQSYTKVTFNNCGIFKGCKSLVALSIPEGTTEIVNRFVAQGCTSLTAFYMPSTIKSAINTNGGGQGPFCDATSMYFVNESFTVGQCLVNGQVDLTKLVLPEKPSVYFMPAGITTFSGHVQTNQYSKGGTIFRNCYNINDTIVFGENFTDMNGYNAFSGMGNNSTKNVVFLADMSGFVTPQSAKNISFIFANEADESLADIGIVHVYKDSSNAGSYMYFCESGYKYAYSTEKAEISDATAIETYISNVLAAGVAETKHICATAVVTNADCVNPEGTTYYCFCGVKADEDITSPALGHQNSSIVAIVYNGANKFFEVGDITYHCDRCNSDHEEVGKGKAAAIFVFHGFSATEVEEYGKSIIQSFVVNREAMTLYNDYTENDVVGYGLVAATELGLGGSTEIFDDAGKVNTNKAGVVNISGRTEKFDLFEIKVNGLEGTYTNPETQATINLSDVKVYCCGYCLVQIGDKVASYYASNGAVTETLSGATSYNELINAQ
ncbi:MAG: leucine-rich repeat protein [Clostridia bacterium]|nr:leucine-rich repeat protein [Clostridia bacterium]